MFQLIARIFSDFDRIPPWPREELDNGALVSPRELEGKEEEREEGRRTAWRSPRTWPFSALGCPGHDPSLILPAMTSADGGI